MCIQACACKHWHGVMSLLEGSAGLCQSWFKLTRNAVPGMPREIHHQRIKVHSVMPRVVDDVVVFLVWYCLIFAQLLSFTVAAGATHKPDRQSCFLPLHIQFFLADPGWALCWFGYNSIIFQGRCEGLLNLQFSVAILDPHLAKPQVMGDKDPACFCLVWTVGSHHQGLQQQVRVDRCSRMFGDQTRFHRLIDQHIDTQFDSR